MIFTLDEARELVRSATGEDAISLPNDTLDMLLNLAYRELLNAYAFRESEVTAVFYTEAGKINYAMPDPHDALRHLSIYENESLESHNVDPMTVDEYTGVFQDKLDARGFPTRYVRESCLFRLWPTPAGVYKMVLRYWGILADMSNTKKTIDIPQIWWTPILDGGIENVFKYKQGDFTRAAVITRFQAKTISRITPTQAKEEEDYHRAGVQVIGINREL